MEGMNLSYTVERSTRKTISMILTREGKIVVRAPCGLSERQIDGFVRKHAAWAERKLAERVAREEASLADGSEVFLFGERYLIERGTSFRWDREQRRIRLPEQDYRESFIRTVRVISLAQMSALTERLARGFGLRYSDVHISSSRSRWGSCSERGEISYSFRVAFLPPSLSEYIAAHELAHTVFMDHSSRFWREVERMLPDCKRRKKELRGYVGIMNCF